jgi:hypothetical protein
MKHISHHGNDIMVDGTAYSMEYPVREAFELDGRLIVLLDADAYLRDPSYPKERRRGKNALRNLRAYTLSGAPLWEAEFPEPADYYYKLDSRAPLTALSFSSYRCRIDPATGRILDRQFLK